MEESKAYLNKFTALAPILIPVDWLSCGGDEFLVGRAGYLAGVLWLRTKLGGKVAAFILGNAGTYAVSAVVSKELGEFLS
ncbi:LanC-like protein 3 [Portunus trituberculatus]|uniref:LanC-like protein 3 n=1 Tax=Portunus trituberculatus TaxID=210409 RepID=A0A5B7JDS2_PORTR|nr:LanC-like protein 3 [Portunus trituberculatus]